MATLFVLDAPEFAPLVKAGGTSAAVAKRGDYVALSGPVIRISRKACGLRRAVWFGALTGGYQGSLERFDEEELVISDV